jgi:hypothetical protein
MSKGCREECSTYLGGITGFEDFSQLQVHTKCQKFLCRADTKRKIHLISKTPFSFFKQFITLINNKPFDAEKLLLSDICKT